MLVIQILRTVRRLPLTGLLTLPPGESVSFAFTGPGEHDYDRSFHPNDMNGVVVVSEG